MYKTDQLWKAFQLRDPEGTEQVTKAIVEAHVL